MAKKQKRSKRKSLTAIRHSSWSKFAKVWHGKERPIMPWIIDTDSPPRPLRKKRKDSKLVRKDHYR